MGEVKFLKKKKKKGKRFMCGRGGGADDGRIKDVDKCGSCIWKEDNMEWSREERKSVSGFTA